MPSGTVTLGLEMMMMTYRFPFPMNLFLVITNVALLCHIISKSNLVVTVLISLSKLFLARTLTLHVCTNMASHSKTCSCMVGAKKTL
jgi:hypothetical protein